MTSIEWTDRVWNPVTGCTKISQGCKNCYAERIANRRLPHGGFKDRDFTEVRCHPERLSLPLSWRKPSRVFVNSTSDLFHEDVSFEFICKVIATCIQAPRHTFQILTKRPDRMLEWSRRHERERHSWPAENVWLGVSVEDQATADERIPLLLETPAAVRFVSYEPALGPVDFQCTPWPASWVRPVDDGSDGIDPLRYCGPQGNRLDWIIVGGESGPGARPFDVQWARSTVEQCKAAGVPVFLKQIGAQPRGWCAVDDRKGADMSAWPKELRVRELPA